MPMMCEKYNAMSFRNKIKKYAESPISRHLVLEELGEYKRPNDKISELIKSEKLIPLRRGLYVTGPELDLPVPKPFLIANHLRGPSYVSLESALSYWDMIPERVHEISSVTIKTSKIYNTPVGRFSYKQLKIPYYSYGLKNVEFSAKQTALVASPEKALCDKIVLTPNINLRSVKQAQEFLFEDLRIDEVTLDTLDTKLMQLWVKQAPKRNSLKILIKTLTSL